MLLQSYERLLSYIFTYKTCNTEGLYIIIPLTYIIWFSDLNIKLPDYEPV